MNFPLPGALMKCKRCGGPLLGNIVPGKVTKCCTYLVICRHCDCAAVAPAAFEPYMDELEQLDRNAKHEGLSLCRP